MASWRLARVFIASVGAIRRAGRTRLGEDDQGGRSSPPPCVLRGLATFSVRNCLNCTARHCCTARASHPHSITRRNRVDTVGSGLWTARPLGRTASLTRPARAPPPPPAYPPAPPAYPPPPPAYPPPPPAYEQPPPAYGQPQPGYGQPQPGYGQPPYGGPQPGYGQAAAAYGQPAGRTGYGYQPMGPSYAYASWGKRVGAWALDFFIPFVIARDLLQDLHRAWRDRVPRRRRLDLLQHLPGRQDRVAMGPEDRRHQDAQGSHRSAARRWLGDRPRVRAHSSTASPATSATCGRCGTPRSRRSPTRSSALSSSTPDR